MVKVYLPGKCAGLVTALKVARPPNSETELSQLVALTIPRTTPFVPRSRDHSTASGANPVRLMTLVALPNRSSWPLAEYFLPPTEIDAEYVPLSVVVSLNEPELVWCTAPNAE